MTFRPSLAPLRNLPLFWKLLVPFLALMIIVGTAGAFLIVRNLTSQAQATLDQDLVERSLSARSVVHDRELYLLESANFASSIEGMAPAVKALDSQSVGRLLQSDLALKKDLDLVAAIDQRGVGVAEFTRSGPGAQPSQGSGTNWLETAFVRRAVADPTGAKASGLMSVGGRTLLVIAAPICSAAPACTPVGVAMVGISVQQLAEEVASGSLASRPATEAVGLYDSAGLLVATTPRASAVGRLPAGTRGPSLVRRDEDPRGGRVGTLYAPFVIQGVPAGTIAVSVPSAPAFAAARGAAERLTLLLLLAMAGIVAIGAGLSRLILGQLRHLVDTNRRLGAGDLAARAPVLGTDELGQVAEGVNLMAEQLQASYETLELRVQQRTEEVARLLRDRTDFFSSLSHELRTPLAVIRNQAEMLLDPGYRRQNPRLADEVALTVHESATQMLSVVNDILDVARAESGRIDVEIGRVKLDEVIDGLRPIVHGLTSGADLAGSIRVPRELPAVAADQKRVREIILNLVDNAAKYTAPGGAVEVSAERRNGHVEVSVRDSGVGIPRDVGERIFEPFYRVVGTHTQRGEGSTGLGLALTRRLVEAQGGTISFESNAGPGTTFTFTVPVWPAPGPRRKGASAIAGAEPTS